MTGLELLLAIVGTGVTAMIVVGMILIVPSGTEPVPARVVEEPAEPVPDGSPPSDEHGRPRAA